MNTNNKITNISAEIAAEYGELGTIERAAFDEKALAFYTCQILREARKKTRLTQTELAQKIGSNKSYISRIEQGVTVPSVATFYRIANALGFNVELSAISH